MKLQENYPLQANNTLALKQHARYFCCANNEDELLQQVHFARQKNISVLMLGEGSNIVLGKDFPGLVIQNAIKGIHVVSEDAESVVLDIGAGENWHALVCHTLHHQWFGLENLALIPGTVGAAPVQNIGAYGVEVCSFVTHVKVLDTETDQWETIDNAHCQFSYRDSVFKHEPGRLLITRVRLRLHKKPRVNVQYQAIKNWFTAQGIVDEKNISPQQVCDAVIAIRRSRLPDPVRMPNAGSFFKKPIKPNYA
jgi:UDP-N-acetylmuramate dehydrogenase